MTLKDHILRHLRMRPGGMTDAELARATGKLHQQVNQRCRQMESEGILVRDPSSGLIVNRLVDVAVPAPRQPAAVEAPGATANRDWSWEGNVQAALCGWLVGEGWSLIQVMNTASKQQGTDVIAERDGVCMHVEVKGFPSRTYADPRRAGEIKPTQPSTQAKHWYADALLKALHLREKHADDRVAMAFPEAPRYHRLLEETATSLRTLRIEVFLVSEDRSVRPWRAGTSSESARGSHGIEAGDADPYGGQ